jgi:hypothetical protein
MPERPTIVVVYKKKWGNKAIAVSFLVLLVVLVGQLVYDAI